jgi:hypothetical protein
MRYVLLLSFLIWQVPGWADLETRYLAKGRILYEAPAEDDVLRVYLQPGFVTKLEVPEDVYLVLIGNGSLVQVEVSGDKRSVILKPLADEGITNLMVDTQNLKLNYEIVIQQEEIVDYRLWMNRQRPLQSHQEPLPKQKAGVPNDCGNGCEE